jgi:hypothetical protein
MGLLIRIHDIVSPNNFDLFIGTSPYGPFAHIHNPDTGNGNYPSSELRDYNTDPIYIGDNNPPISGGTPSFDEVIIPVFEVGYHVPDTPFLIEFDKQYWIKLVDLTNNIDSCVGNNTPRYIVENIFINDSKTFECYDRISFDVTYDPETCAPPPCDFDIIVNTTT